MRRLLMMMTLLLAFFSCAGFTIAQENPFDPGGGGSEPPASTDEWTHDFAVLYAGLMERKESVLHEHETPQDSSPNVYTRVSVWRATARDHRSRTRLSGMYETAKKLNKRVRSIGTLYNADSLPYGFVHPMSYAELNDQFEDWEDICEELYNRDATNYRLWWGSLNAFREDLREAENNLGEVRTMLLTWTGDDIFPLSHYKDLANRYMNEISVALSGMTSCAEGIYADEWHADVDAQHAVMNTDDLAQRLLQWLQSRWDELQFDDVWRVTAATVPWPW